MTNKRLYYWLAQILGWGGIFGINAFVNYSINGYDVKNVVINLVIASIGILLTDLFRWILIKFNWLENGNGKLIMKSIGITLIFSIIHFLLYDQVRNLLGIPESADVGSDLQELPELGRIILSVLSVWMYHLLWGIFYFSFHFAYKSRQASMKNLKLEALQTEIELNNLKSQLNPHFMFNSLNSIRALVDIEPAAAKQSITQLSNILRGSLQMGRKTTVPIADELDLVENYLKMEKIRFEERLQYEFDVDDSLLNFEVPPLVIQTLVENGIKHGISSLIKGGKVLVQIKRTKGKASIIVINDGKLKDVKKDVIGIGLENTKRRLDLVFGKKSEFRLFEEDAQVKAQVLIEI